MTVYLFGLPTVMPPYGLLLHVGPLSALAQPPTQTGYPPPSCVSNNLKWPHRLLLWHTTFLPLQPGGHPGHRSDSAVPPLSSLSALELMVLVLVFWYGRYKKGRIHTHIACDRIK